MCTLFLDDVKELNISNRNFTFTMEDGQQVTIRVMGARDPNILLDGNDIGFVQDANSEMEATISELKRSVGANFPVQPINEDALHKKVSEMERDLHLAQYARDIEMQARREAVENKKWKSASEEKSRKILEESNRDLTKKLAAYYSSFDSAIAELKKANSPDIPDNLCRAEILVHRGSLL